ncbi:MAG: N-acetylmuramoyl-L-alanine amidase [Candidatus Aminicenantes bacterium]|nr:N-acetylmuramoyl-L-alanine amidase [Candidatus Aminicenantes bacterium]
MHKFFRALIIAVISLGIIGAISPSSALARKEDKSVPTVRVSVEDGSGFSRIKINSETNLVYSLKKSGNTLTISFRALSGLKLERKPFTSQLIKSVNLAKSPEAYLLVIKTATEDFNFSQSVRKNPFELVVDLRLKEEKKTSIESRTAASEKRVSQPVQTQPAPVAETSTQNAATRKEVKTIVIDPGHGGIETGARGNFGTLEKDITLAIALKLKEEIERELKYRVVLTREADVVVPLDRRAAIANNNKADLFISIHANGSRRINARGSETFFLSLNATDEEARRLAYFENNSEELENRVTEKDFDDLKLILWDMAQSAYLKQSSQLAEFVQTELNELLNTKNRGIKQAPFKVLAGVACPAILVEVAFITNPEEEKMLQSEEFQAKVAEAIYQGLSKFLQLYEKP